MMSDSCSFCGKGLSEVAKMVRGPRVNICDECVRVSADIIGYDWADEGAVKLESVRDLREHLSRLKGIMHAQGLSDGALYCERCERSWFAEVGIDPPEPCPWCETPCDLRKGGGS